MATTATAATAHALARVICQEQSHATPERGYCADCLASAHAVIHTVGQGRILGLVAIP